MLKENANEILEKFGGNYMPDFGPVSKICFDSKKTKTDLVKDLLLDCIRANPLS